jgi:type II restriction enzyme
MAITQELTKEIEDILISSIRNKFANYKPETSQMPFHTRLLGKDRLALYSFIHSINTNFGVSIFEPIGFALAQQNFKSAQKQIIAGSIISSEAHLIIQKIIDNLTIASVSPDKPNEIDSIRAVCQKGTMVPVNLTRVDLMVESSDNEFYFFDLKTAKPNAGNFREYKRTLLEWVAAFLAINPEANINTLIAIPYNPYAPKPYARWTIRGMIDLENELKVAEEFWDFLGDGDIYQELLDCFERVGIKLRDEIDNYFHEFKNR